MHFVIETPEVENLVTLSLQNLQEGLFYVLFQTAGSGRGDRVEGLQDGVRQVWRLHLPDLSGENSQGDQLICCLLT